MMTDDYRDFSDLQILVKEYNETIENLQERMRDKLKERFKYIFQTWDTLESVNWTQYTPYWNDGDVCVFHVHDWHAMFVNGDEQEGYGWFGRSQKLSKKELATLDGQMHIIHMLPKNMMQCIFGDHAEITVTYNKIQDKVVFNIDDCEHE